MRVRMMLIMGMAIAAVAGYQILSAEPATTTTSPPRTAAKPDANTPHHTVRFRLEVIYADYSSPKIQTTSNPNPARDPQSAKQLRQDPALTADHAAQVRAAASLDCDHDDPLRGKDDPSLPLVTCGPGVFADFFGPALFDGGMISNAAYGPGPVPDRWGVTVTLTPAGAKILAELPRKVVPLAMLFDGRMAAATGVPAKPTGVLEFRFDKEDEARQVAAILNNR